ncbi:hypothetical protein EJ08DRAFT_666304 [Tothia fuscella]|uniref:Ricin B lectin domain-containing protein n=1 Tax=Tothia fuscella TaxID=1048955 RepID=A0A9P4NF95_9PEZI|nr:hypothetical protein EJ08DRAFT_666304 [Tothia fuscella]
MSSENLPDPSAIDGNVWYAMTETRVNWTSSMNHNGKNGLVFLELPSGNVANQNWQFFKLKNGNYALRNAGTGINKQLGTCYNAGEKARSKTQVCLADAEDTPAQEWTIDSSWNDGTFRMQNVANGTGYNLDVHPGTPVFMSDDLDPVPIQPAQHWLMQSKAEINDGAYSTAFGVASTSSAAASSSASISKSSSPASTSAKATATSSKVSSNSSPTTSGTPSSLPSSTTEMISEQPSAKPHSLSPGAGAGIGVASVLIVLLALAGLFFLLRRRKTKRQQKGVVSELAGGHPPSSLRGGGLEDDKKDPLVEVHGEQIQYEMYAQPAELPAGQAYGHEQYDPPRSAVSADSDGQGRSLDKSIHHEPTAAASPLGGRRSTDK